MNVDSLMSPKERREIIRNCSDALILRGLQRPRKERVLSVKRRDLSRFKK